MHLQIEDIHKIAKEARETVLGSSIPSEDVDMVAGVLAALEFIKLKSTHKTSGEAMTEEDIPLTFLEWTNQFQLDGHREKFLAAAVYLYREHSVREITAGAIMELYEKARWPKPQNSADVLGKAANKGLFTEAEIDGHRDDSRKTWRLTRSGIAYFDGLAKEKITNDR